MKIQTAPGLAEQVYQAVLDEICEGGLPAGAHLVQEQLAERYGVSRQPIQQAMALLKADGLIEDVGRRGMRVTALDLTRMRHHYEIRAALDGLAARAAARRANDDPAVAREAQVRGQRILEKGQRAIAKGATGEQIRYDEDFHKLVYELSGNPLLPRTAEIHWRFLRRVMGDVLRHASTPPTIWQQHAAILEAIEAGDPELAEARATDHIRDAAERLSSAMANGGATDAASSGAHL